MVRIYRYYVSGCGLFPFVHRRAHLLRLRFPDYRVRSIGFLLRDILRNSRMVSRRPSRVREKQTITNDMSFTELSLQSE